MWITKIKTKYMAHNQYSALQWLNVMKRNFYEHFSDTI